MLWAIRELAAIVTLRADDRSVPAAGRRKLRQHLSRGYATPHERPKRMLASPRLAFFVMRRRIAATKDAARRILFEIPARTWRHFREFLGEEEVTLTELMYAVGYLVKATFYPAAALLAALATLLGVLAQVGAI